MKMKVPVVHPVTSSKTREGCLPNFLTDSAMAARKIGRRRHEPASSGLEPVHLQSQGIMACAGVEGELSSLLELTAVVT